MLESTFKHHTTLKERTVSMIPQNSDCTLNRLIWNHILSLLNEIVGLIFFFFYMQDEGIVSEWQNAAQKCTCRVKTSIENLHVSQHFYDGVTIWAVQRAIYGRESIRVLVARTKLLNQLVNKNYVSIIHFMTCFILPHAMYTHFDPIIFGRRSSFSYLCGKNNLLSHPPVNLFLSLLL